VQNANTLNLALNRVTVGDARDAGWGAGENDVAREKGYVFRDKGNNGFHIEDHVFTGGVLTLFALNTGIQTLTGWVKFGFNPWA
jgi:hypothetical protein